MAYLNDKALAKIKNQETTIALADFLIIQGIATFIAVDPSSGESCIYFNKKHNLGKLKNYFAVIEGDVVAVLEPRLPAGYKHLVEQVSTFCKKQHLEFIL